MTHNDKCKFCREYSTDGTLLGAHIAHTMGTDNEQEILENAIEEDRRLRWESLTGVPEEQAEWEST